MSQNNSNDRAAMLAQIETINQVNGFDPAPFAVDYTDLGTGEVAQAPPGDDPDRMVPPEISGGPDCGAGQPGKRLLCGNCTGCTQAIKIRLTAIWRRLRLPEAFVKTSPRYRPESGRRRRRWESLFATPGLAIAVLHGRGKI